MVKHTYIIITKALRRGNYYPYLIRLGKASLRLLSKKSRATKSNPGHIWISETKMISFYICLTSNDMIEFPHLPLTSSSQRMDEIEPPSEEWRG